MKRLDPELLEALRERLIGVGIPFDDWTNPGLSIEQIDRLATSVGLRLPEEAVLWWSWRDGAPFDRPVLPDTCRFCSLQRAVDVYKQVRDVARKGAAGYPHGDPDLLWKPEWFPLDDNKFHNVIDCGADPAQPTPIRSVIFEARPWENEEIRAESMGELVALWCEAIDAGVWLWARDKGQWFIEDQPVAAARSPLT